MKEHNEGFSIIELVVVTAILVIMSGGAVFGLSYLDLANSSKCAAKIDSGMAVLKSKNMAQVSATYMHLYNMDGDYYIEYSNDPDYVPSDSEHGEMIGNNRLTVSYKEGNEDTETVIGENECKTFGIRKKDGAFTGTTEPTCEIYINGKSKHAVTLVTNTGKHFID